jgi:hypothetical protein
MELWRNVIPVVLQMLLVYMLMLAKIVINEVLPWRLWQHIPRKRLQLSTQLCNITSQNTIILTLYYTNWYVLLRPPHITYIHTCIWFGDALSIFQDCKMGHLNGQPRSRYHFGSILLKQRYLLQKLLLGKAPLSASSTQFKTCPLLKRMQLTCIAWMQSLNT